MTELQQFKDDYDKNQPLWKVLPEFVQKNPRYERVGLRDLCRDIHAVYRANDVARLTTEMYLSDMIPAMKPADAFAKMAHRKIERVAIDELEGPSPACCSPPTRRASAADPGRALQPHGGALPAVRPRVQRTLPGFETDVHGLVKEVKDGHPLWDSVRGLDVD